MAAGLPVICLDLGGPASQITKESGIKIPANTPDQAVKDLANAMLKLADNPHLRRDMGKAGCKRVVDYFNWDSQGEWINNLYKKIVK
jgi:glycosyltransferase involved in cell wall biosynthesis